MEEPSIKFLLRARASAREATTPPASDAAAAADRTACRGLECCRGHESGGGEGEDGSEGRPPRRRKAEKEEAFIACKLFTDTRNLTEDEGEEKPAAALPILPSSPSLSILGSLSTPPLPPVILFDPAVAGIKRINSRVPYIPRSSVSLTPRPHFLGL